MIKNYIICIIFCLMIFSCSNNKTIKIGFVGSLSGKNYNLGVDSRNSVQLLINEINSKGGIHNRKIELIIEDTKSDINNIEKANQNLLNKGVIVLFGHFTSSDAEKSLDFINKNKIVLISPTASSEELSGKDDYFFRTIMSAKYNPIISSEIMKKNNIKNIIIIQNSTNKTYAKTFTDHLTKEFNIIKDILFTNLSEINFIELAKIKDQFDSVFIIANSIDTGTICQNLKINNIVKPVYISGWGGNNDLIKYGGNSVENVIFVSPINDDMLLSTEFYQQYIKQYNEIPSLAAIESYNAFMLIIKVLEKKAFNKTKFYNELKKISYINSICGTIIIDKYGDAIRDIYLKKVENGKIKIIDKISINE